MDSNSPQDAGAPQPTAEAPNFDDIQDVGAQGAAAAPAAQPEAEAPNFDDIQDVGAQPSNAPAESGQDNAPGFYQRDLQAQHDDAEQTTATAEGLAQGFLSKPVATWVEKNLFGVAPEDIAAREEEHSTAHMVGAGVGLIGGLTTGVGELGLINKGIEAGQAGLNIAKASTVAGKIGGAAIKGAIEMGLLDGTDEIGNAMLGKGDPEAPVSAALSHMGAAALLGAGFGALGSTGGAALTKLAETKAGSAVSKVIKDFGDKIRFMKENPDPVAKMTQEFTDLVGSTDAIRNDLHGANAVKDKLAAKLGADIAPEKMAEHVNQVDTGLQKFDQLMEDRTFKKQYAEWQEAMTSPNATNGDKIMATDKLKKQLDFRAKWDKTSAFGVTQEIRDASHMVRDTLEDTKTLGEFGNFQKNLNSLYKENIPKLEDAKSRFMQGDAVDPGKFQTYVNQEGKAYNTLRTADLQKAVDVHEKFVKGVNDIYARYGMESPVVDVPLTAIRESLKSPSAGAKMADYMMNVGSQSAASKMVQSGIGAEEGYRHHGIKGALAGWAVGAFAPTIEKHIVRKINSYAIPALIRTLSTDNAQHVLQALDHANMVNSGAQKINRGITNVFKAGSEKALETSTSKEHKRKKLDKLVEENALGQQTKDLAKDQPTPAPTIPQMYAKGGEVQPTAPAMPVPAAPSEPTGRQVVFPEQDMAINAAKSRIHGYLNSIRPAKNNNRLPFDKDHKSKQKENSYNQALDLANDPVSILNHVKAGSVTNDMMKHFVSLYPEMHGHMSKKLVQKIIESQSKGTTVPYKTRQGLALFMGKPMDSTMLPMNIQAAQPLPPPPPPQNKTGSPKKNLKGVDRMPKEYQTPAQSAEQDMAKR